MLQLVCRLQRSIGKKAVMAVTGLLLSGFLVTHLAGNLFLFLGPEAFNKYADTLSSNPLLPVAEAGLAFLFLSHIVSGLQVTWENRAASPQKYAVDASHGARSLMSATMPYTGMLLIVFLAIHIWTFRLADHNIPGGLYEVVRTSFQNPIYTGFYILSMGGIILHTAHGFSSAFQTLGVNHPKYNQAIKLAGWGFGGAMFGFVALVVFMFACAGA